MEKTILKWIMYSFFLSLALSVLFVDYKIITPIDVESYTTEYVPLSDYIISLIRYSILGAFAGGIAGWRLYKFKNTRTQPNTYYVEMFVGAFCLAMIIGVLSFIN
ncbi:hypothetical protein ACFFJY_03980 [Fictibacillus aquaticus]|uniref:hypothetical protein n=1 Tax=Fictibacillus aquaticus TaxID=2021314 RepID=UPI0035EBDCBE